MSGFDGLLRETMILVALLCIPVLGIAALVGTAVAVVQAATQVQEQTLTMLPKLVAVGCVVGVFGIFGIHACEALFHHALDAIPQLVSGQ